MSISKIIFLTISRFSQRDYERFGIDILKYNGFEVEVFDISGLFYRGKSYKHDLVHVKCINSYQLLTKYLSEEDNRALYIELYGSSSKLFKVEMLLTKYNARVLLFNLNILPISISKQSFLYKVGFFIASFSIKSFFQRVTYFINKNKLKKYDFILIGGEKGKNVLRVGEQTQFIYGHTLDYDIFIEQSKESKILDYSYAVFLDEYLPYHPDEEYVSDGKYLKSIATQYYEKLNIFFDYIEKKYDLKIVIAIHPRANYLDANDYFKDRFCIKGKTNLLVRDCKFCIGHFSTSINFVVLHYKPMIFITMKEIDSLFSEFIERFAEELGNKKIFIDDMFKKNNIDDSLKLNIIKYEEYIENYIKKPNTQEKNSWQVLSDFIKAYCI